MKKQAVKNIIKTVCFLLVLTAALSLSTYVLRNKNEANIVLPYYDEPENSLDVVFVGSSQIMCGIYPMELYSAYGITSYNFASSAQSLPQSYYQVLEALNTQTPKLLVLDCSAASYSGKLGSADFIHVQFDNMRLTPVKLRAINDLIENPSERLEYYLSLYRFHTRWKELTPVDFAKIISVTKGAVISTAIGSDCAEIEIIHKTETAQIDENAQIYLIKIIELCQKRGINLLLLKTPACRGEEFQRKYNKVYEIADAYGLTYLNLMYNLGDMGFDFLSDMRDGAHCNASGALKVTAFIGEYLKSHYNLPDRRADPDYAYWNTQYSKYRQEYDY